MPENDIESKPSFVKSVYPAAALSKPSAAQEREPFTESAASPSISNSNAEGAGPISAPLVKTARAEPPNAFAMQQAASPFVSAAQSQYPAPLPSTSSSINQE